MSLPNNYVCEGQLSIEDVFSPDLWSGRTSQEHLVQTAAKTSEPLSKKPQRSSAKMPLFLDLRGANGHRADASWEKGGALLGVYTMHSFGECPSAARESRLSQILEENPLLKYCLSAKACQGILRRAQTRGKELPKILKETLEKQSLSKNEPDVRGGARESSSRENEQEHSQPLTTNPSSSKAYGRSSYASNAMLSPNPHSGIYEADTARTLDNNGGNPACNQGGMIVLEGNGARESHKGPGYAESETMFTLNTVEQHSVCYQETTGPLCPGAHAGSYNGQDAYNDMLVVENGGGVEPVTASKASFFLNARSDGTADTLVATDYKDPQLVCYGLDRASFNQGQNALYDFSVEQELAQPLIARGPGGGTDETVGALCARDYKGIGNQYVWEGKCIVQNLP